MAIKSKDKAKTQSGKRKRGESMRKVKRYLQSGDITEIAAEVGVTTKTVGNIIAGRSTNWLIAEKLVARAEHNKAIKERAQSL
jgi:hypothetical protein